MIRYQESVWKRFDSFLGHVLRNISVKVAPQLVNRYACGTWHCSCRVTNIHSIHKSIRNSQKLGKSLGN